MTDTLIAITSLLVGIVGANCIGLLCRNCSFGLIGNTIAGVFGSALLIKSFGRLGFDPKAIMFSGTVDLTLFSVNMFVSFLGGGLAVLAACWLKKTIKKKEEKNRR